MSVHHPTEWVCSHDSSATLAAHRQAEAGPLARLVRAVAVYLRRRRKWRALCDLSDAELRDIGIRADIERVFGPGFARGFAREFTLPGAALHELR